MDIMTPNAPLEWNLYRLGQVFHERKEKGSDKDFQPLSVTMQGIVPQLDTAAKSDDSDNRKIVRCGDYVINSRSDRKGSGGISPLDGSVSLISIVLEPIGINRNFAHHLLRSTAFQEEFYRWGHGIVADLWTTRFSDMKNIRLRLPSRDTQKQIADFLDRETARIDQLIGKRTQQAELLKEKRRSFISRTVTSGFPESDQCVTTSSRYLPKVPSSWTLIRLKHLGKIRGGLTLGRTIPENTPTRSIPYLRVANVQAGWLDLSEVVETDVTDKELTRYSLSVGDVLMNEGGDNDKLGRGAVWHAPFEPCLNQNHVFVVTPHNPDHAEWISLSTNAQYARDFFYLHSNQSTNLASISKANLSEFPVPLPPPDELKKILQVVRKKVSELDNLTECISQSIDRLREYRSALITAAVTGQIDVTTWGKSGAVDRQLDAIQDEMGAA